MASSRRRRGSARGSSWTAKEMWPRRWPKRVPVTLRPSEGVMERLEGMASHLHAGIIVGKVKMLRNDRTRTESLLLVLAVVGLVWWLLLLLKEETEGEEPRRMRSLSATSSGSEARERAWWPEGMILLLLNLAVLVLVLLWRMRFCSCFLMLC